MANAEATDDKHNRPRGLCWSCYFKPGVLKQYPSTSPYANRGPKLGTAPATPTTAFPGTPEKLAVLRERLRNGQAAWAVGDAALSCVRYPLHPEDKC